MKFEEESKQKKRGGAIFKIDDDDDEPMFGFQKSTLPTQKNREKDNVKKVPGFLDEDDEDDDALILP